RLVCVAVYEVERDINSFLDCRRDHLHLLSFPTRRSSDLHLTDYIIRKTFAPAKTTIFFLKDWKEEFPNGFYLRGYDEHKHPLPRSEEHTPELQSRFELVCRLLLEKKTTNQSPDRMTEQQT